MRAGSLLYPSTMTNEDEPRVRSDRVHEDDVGDHREGNDEKQEEEETADEEETDNSEQRTPNDREEEDHSFQHEEINTDDNGNPRPPVVYSDEFFLRLLQQHQQLQDPLPARNNVRPEEQQGNWSSLVGIISNEGHREGCRSRSLPWIIPAAGAAGGTESNNYFGGHYFGDHQQEQRYDDGDDDDGIFTRRTTRGIGRERIGEIIQTALEMTRQAMDEQNNNDQTYADDGDDNDDNDNNEDDFGE